MLKNKKLMEKKWFYFLIYTVLFCIISTLVFRMFFVEERTLIWFRDGWSQHLRALRYYRQYLQMIFHTIFVEHSFDIPNYSFELGSGGDIFSTLGYYMIGDPVSLLMGLVPDSWVPNMYSFLIVLRIYLSGLAFSVLCFYLGKKNFMSIWVGSLSYAFCGYVFYAIRHPFFLNPMIYLPLLILGVELILREHKCFWLSIFVFFAVSSNFYFFYMEVLYVVFYVVFRLGGLVIRKEVFTALKNLIKIAISSIVGVGLGAVFLVPTMFAFFSDKRISLDVFVAPFYPVKTYKALFQGLVSFGDAGYLSLGFTIITLWCIYLLVREKGNHLLKVIFLCLSIIILFPYTGHVFNGFSYACDRYIFGYSLIVCFIIVEKWPALMKNELKKNVELFLVTLLYAILGFAFGIEYGYNQIYSISFGFMLILICIVGREKKGINYLKEYFFLCTALIVLCINADNCFSLKGSGCVAVYERYRNVINNIDKNESKSIQMLNDQEEFFRVAGKNISRNANLGLGVYGMQYYWSFSNAHVWDFLSSVGNLDNMAVNLYDGVDDRTILNTLVGTKYYTTRTDMQSQYVPRGYDKLVSNLNGFDVYINNNRLPFGYVYSSCVSMGDYSLLSMEQREQIMLQSVVLEDDKADLLIKKEPYFDEKEIDYEFISSENVRIGNQCIYVDETQDEEEACVYLLFEPEENADLYLVFEGLQYKQEKFSYASVDGSMGKKHNQNEPASAYIDISSFGSIELQDGVIIPEQIYEKRIIQKELRRTLPASIYNTGREDFIVNLNSCKGEKGLVRIYFKQYGTYSFDSLRLVQMPLGRYSEFVKERKKDTLENLSLHKSKYAGTTNHITASIQASEPELLVMELPYSKGWTAYVDGEEREIIQSNIMFSGLFLDEGKHDIELRYETPGLKLGCTISFGCLLLFVLWLYVVKRIPWFTVEKREDKGT